MANPLVVSLVIKGSTDGVKAASQLTKNELDGVEKAARSASATIAQSSAVMNNQAAVSARVAASTKLQAHEVTNLTYQLNDMATMMASGQSPFIMMMQQGPQISQILGPRGLGQIIPALGQGLMSLVTPTNLLLAGLLAVGYAGATAYRMIYPEVEPLNDVLERQAALLAEIKKAYDAAANASGSYGGRSIATLKLLAEEENKLIRLRLKSSVNDTGLEFGLVGGGGGRSGGRQRTGPISEAYDALAKSSREGNPDFKAFQETLTTIASDKSFEDNVRAQALALIKFTEEAAKAQQQLGEFGKRANASEPNISLFREFQRQEKQTQDRMREANRAALLGLNARSPQAQATAARTSEAAQYNDNESGATRGLRIELAGTVALAKANQNLIDMQRSRLTSLNETMATADLDLSLIGKSASEVERLKLEHQLLGAARAAAAQAGVQADEQELALIRQKAAAYAELKTLTDARGFIQSKNEELAKLRLEQQLIGTTASVRAASMASYEAEIEIRKRGLDVQGEEAKQIRANAAALASVTSELDRQKDAWGKVQSAGENALDLLVDGDFDGALKEVSKTLLDIAVKNPLKNALLGTENGTLSDLGGFSGLLSKLLGGANDNAPDAVSSALAGSSVSSMSVTAASVVINGSGGGLAKGIADIIGGGKFEANTSLDDVISGAVNASQTGGGNALRTVGNFKGGVDDRLMDILNMAAQKFGGYQVDAISGFRAGDPRYHGKGLATDVQLTDLVSGRKLGNYQDASSFGQYEKFAQTARQVQLEKYPELTKDFRWGGYFGGGKGKYGAMDQMHFDLGGRRTGMGGGSFEGGLNDNQMRLFPGAESKGMTAAARALEKFSTSTDVATSGVSSMAKGLDGMGNGLTKFGQNLSQANLSGGGSGGGISGLFSSIFGGSSQGSGTTIASILASGGGGLFSSGDWTGAGGKFEPAGIVHRDEFVFTKEQTNAIGVKNLRALAKASKTGFAEGGFAGRSSSSSSGALATNQNSRPNIQFVNNGTPQRVTSQRDEDDGQGGRRTVYVLEDMIAAAQSRPGSPVGKSLTRDFGVGRRTVQR
jgi:hypothetical protein